MNQRENLFADCDRVVIKAGSGVLTGTAGLNRNVVSSISRGINALMDRQIEVIFVSSGALAAGARKLGRSPRPDDLPTRQAVAAAGQARLIMAYEKAFARHGRQVAQILLTSDDLSSRKRYLNARNTINTLLHWQVIPIINENDTVAVEEIKFGDNDNLAAMITLLMDADILINLTDIDGLYDQDPRAHDDARLLTSVASITRSLEKAAGAIPGPLGTGGMLSKLKAARKLMSAGVPMIIANGRKKDILTDLFAGRPLGTYFEPGTRKLPSRKRWIAFSCKPRGTLTLDDGAARAITERGKSLLPGGISAAFGEFGVGAPVELINRAGQRLGVGLVNYSAADIRTIMGLKSTHIKKILGHQPYDEVVHRNNLVVC
ncbi:MAG: glutamate 5-kinase [Desulfosudaceae bacterium]